jgi:multiple antibiotic resistance protein
MNLFDTKMFGEAFITLFVIMDPPGTLPLFLSLTGGRTQRTRRKLAGQAALVSLCVICVFALFGQRILDYLGVSVPALQGSGGLLLLLIALALLTGKSEEHPEAGEVNVALVPLGTPLLAGPGAIVAVIVFARQTHHLSEALALATAILAIHVVLWLTMRFSVVIIRVIKESGVTLVTRISGLLLSAIAVQMIADAVIAFAANA